MGPPQIGLSQTGAAADRSQGNPSELPSQGEALQSPGPVVGVMTSLAESWASDSAGQ